MIVHLSINKYLTTFSLGATILLCMLLPFVVERVIDIINKTIVTMASIATRTRNTAQAKKVRLVKPESNHELKVICNFSCL